MSCPACGAALAPWRPGLERCDACGTARTTLPAPAQARGYGPGRGRARRAAAPIVRLFLRERLRILRTAVAPPAKVLDVGAGRGAFVAAAKAAGYEATGIEPAGGDGGARGADEPGVLRAGVFDAAISPGTLDAATLWHVLEHLDAPAAALERIGGWLRPGGALIVAVPNLASLQARIGGERWFHLDVPRHRTHFTPRGLRALLERTGFSVVAERHVLAEHNPFGMWQTFASRVSPTPSWLFRALQGDARLLSLDALLHLAALPLLPAAALGELAAGLARRGGTIVVLARRADRAG